MTIVKSVYDDKLPFLLNLGTCETIVILPLINWLFFLLKFCAKVVKLFF